MIVEDRAAGLKILLTGGVVALGVAMGYSMGLRHKLDSPAAVIGLAPVDASSIGVLERSSESARARGDVPTAEWFAEVAKGQRSQLLAWAADRAHGRAGAPGAQGAVGGVR